MIFENQHQIAALTTCIFTYFLAVVVLVKGFRLAVARCFGIYTFAISAWSFCWFNMIFSAEHSKSLFWACWIHVPASFIPATFLHFVQILLGIQTQRAHVWGRRMLYTFGAFFAAACFRKEFCADVVRKLGFRFYLEPGPLYITFFIFFIAAVVYILHLLLAAFKKAKGSKKIQIGYVLPAYVLAYAGGAAVFLPVYNVPIPSFALYSIPISHLIIAYAILRHRLLDITIIIRKTLLYSLMSMGVAAIYAGAVALIAQIWGGWRHSTPFVSSGLAAIVITILFNPLRLRAQWWIDRYFPRERLDPELLQEAAGGFAHEMKRPLSKISLPAEMALMDLERVEEGEMTWKDALPQVKERLRFIMNQSIDAGYLIEAIQELSATSSSPSVPVDVHAILENVLTTEGELLRKYGVSAKLHWPAAFPPISGRARQLEIVFINLVKNAVEAMSDLAMGRARDITIEAHADGPWAVIRVKDSGPGIKPEDKEKLFLPHYTTKGPRGTGMGLYLSRQIVQGHGGTIEVVASSREVGTTFVVSLACNL